MTRTVPDAALLDQILARGTSENPDLPVADLSFGVPDRYFTHPLDAGTEQVWQLNLDELSRAGITLVPVQVAGFDTIETTIGMPITLYEARRELVQYLRTSVGISLAELIEGVSSDDVRAVLESAVADGATHTISDEQYQQAQRKRLELQQQYAHIFSATGVDAITFPTTPLPAAALPVGSEVTINGTKHSTFLSYIRNTGPGTLAGLPGLTLPAGRTSGNLPVGLALDGPAGSDRRLLAVGALVQNILTTAATGPRG